MSRHVERTGERERPDDQVEPLFAAGFPAFITADQLAKQSRPADLGTYVEPNVWMQHK